MSPDTRFIIPLGTIVIFILVCLSFFVLYGPLEDRIPSSTGSVLVGGVSCSLALFLGLFFLWPVRK